jgi:hypothetical protein
MAKNNLMALLLTGRCGEQKHELHGTEQEQAEPPKWFRRLSCVHLKRSNQARSLAL